MDFLSLSVKRLVAFLLKESSRAARMLDWMKLSRQLPLVRATTVEELDHGLAGKEEPVVPSGVNSPFAQLV